MKGLTAIYRRELAGLFLAPLAQSVPAYATAAALLFVASIMARSLADIDWDDVTESAPAVIAALAMPLTYSIAEGIGLGFICYVLIKLVSGKASDCSLAAYLIAAIFALLAAKYLGVIWADPAMGVVGAILVARWSLGLVRSTSQILLDRKAPEELCEAVRECIESDGDDRIVDLHVWSVGPNIYSAIVALVTHDPKPPNHYKALIPKKHNIVHVTIEVHACDDTP